jgi:8-oxo-dGTP pyrophosphatase MutT (NUDIX family)
MVLCKASQPIAIGNVRKYRSEKAAPVGINRSSLPEISAQTKQTWTRIRHDNSAGGVAYRRVAGQGDKANTIEVALIATRGGRRWQLPKGSREADESSLETAIREVHEEVGLHTEHEAFLKRIDYWYWDTYRKDVPELVHKSVDFYLLRVVGGALSDASYEVDGVGWFTLEHAQRILTFAGEREVLRMAQARLRTGAD